MNNWIKGSGWIQINDAVRIVSDLDICRYYQWFIKKQFWNTVKTQLPKHGTHITIVNPKIYKGGDFKAIQQFKNKRVEFEYNPSEMYISRVNFWIPVKCDVVKTIRDILNIKEYGCDKGPHMTVCNKKFNDPTQNPNKNNTKSAS
jgi:hypothetical protein